MNILFYKILFVLIIGWLVLTLVLSTIDESAIQKDCKDYDGHITITKGGFLDVKEYKVICIKIDENNQIITKVVVRK